MRIRLRYAALVTAASLGIWIGLYPVDWQNWLGFSHNAYFTWGQNYAFTSGPGPMMETGIGLSTIIGGLWHHLNCHTAGCPRIVRHKIAGGEYGVCGRHWRQISGHGEKHRFTIEHLRDRHEAHLRSGGRTQ